MKSALKLIATAALTLAVGLSSLVRVHAADYANDRSWAEWGAADDLPKTIPAPRG